jgi:hypothetical protein
VRCARSSSMLAEHILSARLVVRRGRHGTTRFEHDGLIL